ncbi:MAG: carboxy terminal-processing peptidase [Opitutales bacterium]|nr:carboxy terminal-processing peptidase [Opitutales bacterium]
MTAYIHRITRCSWILTVLFIGVYSGAFGQNADTEQEELKPAEPLKATTMMRRETQWVVGMVERAHYTQRAISELDYETFITSYMADLDTNHLYFLQEDVDEFSIRFANSMRGWLRRGDLYPAFEIFNRFRENALERIRWIETRLDSPFNFTSAESYRPDREEEGWPLSNEDANTIWERRLTYELLNEVLPDVMEAKDELDDEASEEALIQAGVTALDKALPEAVDKLKRRYQRWRESLLEIDSHSVQETYITALTHLYDPHSTFMSADTMEDFAMSMRNSFVGIGALLFDEDGYCTIRELLPGGPAERSRELASGDVIVGVGQGREGNFVDVIDMNLKKIVKLIKGERRTLVRLKIRPNPESAEERIISLVRDEIKLTANLASAEIHEVPMGEQTVAVGVVDLPSFYGGEGAEVNSTTADVEELIGKLSTTMSVQGLVLDLRRNGGGLLSEAISLTGLFIPEGPVVRVRDTLENTRDRFDEDSSYVWRGPLSVLVSRYSASASEIVAGALQAHDRAIIVGDENTHGKGTVQAIFEMPNRSLLSQLTAENTGAAKITIQKFYLPNGSSTQHLGVSSDIDMPTINTLLPIGESDHDNALPWDTIEPVRWGMRTDEFPDISWLNTDIRSMLLERSTERQELLPEFDYIRGYIEWFKRERKKELVSLNLEQRISERKQNSELRDEMDEELRRLAEYNFSKSEILLKIQEEQDALAEQFEKDIAEIRAEDEQADNEEKSESEEVAQIEEEEEVEDLPDFDIYLREALRITRDWVALESGSLAEVVNTPEKMLVKKDTAVSIEAATPQL